MDTQLKPLPRAKMGWEARVVQLLVGICSIFSLALGIVAQESFLILQGILLAIVFSGLRRRTAWALVLVLAVAGVGVVSSVRALRTASGDRRRMLLVNAVDHGLTIGLLSSAVARRAYFQKRWD